MANTPGSDNPFPSVLLVEHADPATPPAGTQRLWVDTDKSLKLIDDAAAVTAIGGTIADILDLPTSETDDTKRLAPDGAGGVEWAAGGGGGAVATDAIWDNPGDVALGTGANTAAVASRPELIAQGAAGTPIAFTAPTLDTGVTDGAVTGYARRLIFPANGTTYADVASSIGTGDFDVRARVCHVGALIADGTTAFVNLQFYVTDSGRTSSTRLCVKTFGYSPGDVGPFVRAVVGTTEGGAAVRPATYPVWLRMVRVGTAVTFYCSFTEEATWCTLHTATSSLNIARIGFLGLSSATTLTLEALIHQVKSV